jgi:hypothetical protein
MFSKLATTRNFDHQQEACVAFPAHVNDNRLDRRAVRPVRRQPLSCRWRVNSATGRLECTWRTEVADTEDPLSDSRMIAVFVLARRAAPLRAH